ncbi:hypothetical protein RVR_10534 [Actinacidiphila reveromycinica]|uniref:Uncharacterized protein n=1 Tax=Actinacidiphila reveromycinica TaxID=659352 RepID=A0A7U3VRT2_9ACTN|nr:hypothetical protein [Streptomyces sp. SN-593]BBB01099.1 hypothetical protein RVR_10534 [Streptomyces sp. SN-593]
MSRPVPQPRPICGACTGNKGKTVDGRWVTCAACQGTGLSGGQQ